jgi:hypothetical protein
MHLRGVIQGVTICGPQSLELLGAESEVIDNAFKKREPFIKSPDISSRDPNGLTNKAK